MSVQHLFVRQAKHASCEHPISPKDENTRHANNRTTYKVLLSIDHTQTQ